LQAAPHIGVACPSYAHVQAWLQFKPDPPDPPGVEYASAHAVDEADNEVVQTP
jgi:hypothetical protein